MSAMDSTDEFAAESLRLSQQLEVESQNVIQLRLELDKLKTTNTLYLDLTEQMEKGAAEWQEEIEKIESQKTFSSTLRMETYASSIELRAAEVAYENLRYRLASWKTIIPIQQQQLIEKRAYLEKLKKRAEFLAETEKRTQKLGERIAAYFMKTLQDGDQPPDEIELNVETTEVPKQDEIGELVAEYMSKLRILSAFQ